MSEAPVPRGPGRDEVPPGVPADYPRLGSPGWQLMPSGPQWPEWMDDEGYLAARSGDDPGEVEEEYQDPDNAPPAGLDDAELAELIAQAREVLAGQAAAAAAMAAAGQAGVLAAVASVASGRRGPGMPGSAQTFPVSTPAGRRGSRRVSRWMSRRAARCWPSSPMRPPGRVTGTGVRRMMSWSG